jgi:hypothetical protein
LIWSFEMPITELHKRRRGRNIALAGALALLVALFFVITLVKLEGLSWGQW